MMIHHKTLGKTMIHHNTMLHTVLQCVAVPRSHDTRDCMSWRCAAAIGMDNSSSSMRHCDTTSSHCVDSVGSETSEAESDMTTETDGIDLQIKKLTKYMARSANMEVLSPEVLGGVGRTEK